MKKLLLLLLVCLSSHYSNAQFYGGGFISGWCYECYTSIEAGVISSSIEGLENSSNKTGLYLGVYQNAYLNDFMSLRTGLTYNNLGAEIEGFKDPLIIHSINTPISLHFIFDQKIQVFGGLEIGANLFGKFPTNENSDNFDQSFDFSDNIEFLDLSALFGVGYIIADHIDINVKYNLGLTDISDNPALGELKKNWFTLSVGYSFRD